MPWHFIRLWLKMKHYSELCSFFLYYCSCFDKGNISVGNWYLVEISDTCLCFRLIICDIKDNLDDTSLLAAAFWITGVAELLLLPPSCWNSDENSIAGLANVPLTSSTLSSVGILIFEFALCKIWFTVSRNVGWFNIFLKSLSILLPSCSTLLSAISLSGGRWHAVCVYNQSKYIAGQLRQLSKYQRQRL